MKITRKEVHDAVRPDGVYRTQVHHGVDETWSEDLGMIMSKESFREAYIRYVLNAEEKTEEDATPKWKVAAADAESIASKLVSANDQIVKQIKHLDHGNMFDDAVEVGYNYCKDEVLEIIEKCLKGILS